MSQAESNLTPLEKATVEKQGDFQPSQTYRYALDRGFAIATGIAIFIALSVLVTLLIDIGVDGIPRLSWDFINSFPSRRPQQAGILSALVGSLWLLSIVITFAFPVGISTGIFLEEFAPDNWFKKMIEVNINNLAGVPSIIYGLLGLQVFVRLLEPITGGRTLLAGGWTLSLLVLPIIIVATRESLRSVSQGIRAAAMALGATQWQMIWHQVLPQALPGILTGTILALSRGIGEAASLITIGALTFIAFLPPLSLEGFHTSFTALPIQTFNWVSRPQQEFHTNAAAAIVVLLTVLICMNSFAVYLRNRFQRR